MVPFQQALPPAVDHFSFSDAAPAVDSYSDVVDFSAWNEGTKGSSHGLFWSSGDHGDNDQNAITKYEHGNGRELSLRDLLDLPNIVNSMEQKQGTRREFLQHKPKSCEERKETNKAKNRASSTRRQSMSNEVILLKMFFPISFGGRRRKSSDVTAFFTIGATSSSTTNSSNNRSRGMGGCSFFSGMRRSKAKKN